MFASHAFMGVRGFACPRERVRPERALHPDWMTVTCVQTKDSRAQLLNTLLILFHTQRKNFHHLLAGSVRPALNLPFQRWQLKVLVGAVRLGSLECLGKLSK